MQAVYVKAVSQLGSPSSNADDTRHLRDERLAAHLMTFYWRGLCSLEDDSGILRRFFAHAPDKIRAEAIEFIGRSLARTEGSIESNVLRRLQDLWIVRFIEARSDPTAHRAELNAFGWCFGSGKFEARWAVDSLLAVLKLTGSIDPDFQVLERLPDYVSDFPKEIVECVKLLVEGQTSLIELSSWEGDLRRILMQTREHLTPEVRSAGNEVIERLGRLGYVGYRDLRSSN